MTAVDIPHMHCPHGCEHPQPFQLDDGRFVCGWHAIIAHELVVMIPCTPEVCGEDREEVDERV